MRARNFDGHGRDTINLADYFASVTDALEGYRAIKLYIDTVMDHYEYELITGRTLNAKLEHVMRNKIVSAAIVSLLENQMHVYSELCRLYGEAAIRRAKIVEKKYFTMPGKGQLEDSPYSNEELAEHFGVDASTVRRDLICARKELKFLFFGAQKQ